MLESIKCTLALWHEVWPLKPPLSSDWVETKTSQLALVEAGGLALAKEPPDKMQGARKVQSDGWSLQFNRPIERSTDIFHRAQLPQPERSRVGFLPDRGPTIPACEASYARIVRWLQNCKSAHFMAWPGFVQLGYIPAARGP